MPQASLIRFWLCLLTLVCGVVSAHPDLELQIEGLDGQIALNPGNAELYLKRGDLFRRHGELERAFADVSQARMLDPGNWLLDWYEGRIALDAGDFALANKHFSLYINAQPEDATVYYLRGMARDGLRQYLFAADDYARSIALSQHPSPALFRSQALSLMAADEWSAAEKVSKSGLSRFPREFSLLGLAVESTLIRMDTQQALSYFARLPKRLLELPQWQFRTAIWHCIEGNEAEAAAGFSKLLPGSDQNASPRAGTWTVPLATLSALKDQPQAEACRQRLKDGLLEQLP